MNGHRFAGDLAQANEIHYVLQPDNTQYMYLSTYGWSMFRAPLP